MSDEEYALAWNAGYNDALAGSWFGEEYEDDQELLDAYSEGWHEGEQDWCMEHEV